MENERQWVSGSILKTEILCRIAADFANANGSATFVRRSRSARYSFDWNLLPNYRTSTGKTATIREPTRIVSKRTDFFALCGSPVKT